MSMCAGTCRPQSSLSHARIIGHCRAQKTGGSVPVRKVTYRREKTGFIIVTTGDSSRGRQRAEQEAGSAQPLRLAATGNSRRGGQRAKQGAGPAQPLRLAATGDRGMGGQRAEQGAGPALPLRLAAHSSRGCCGCSGPGTGLAVTFFFSVGTVTVARGCLAVFLRLAR